MQTCPGERSWALGCLGGEEGSQAREEERGIATGELQSQPGLSCKVLRSRGAFAGSPGVRDSSSRNVGKVSEGQAAECPGMNLPSAQLPAFPFSSESSRGRGVLACFAACVAPTQGWRLEAISSSCSPPKCHFSALRFTLGEKINL